MAGMRNEYRQLAAACSTMSCTWTWPRHFAPLADSTRTKIVHSLMDQPLCVCDLAQVVGVSEPAVSQHLRLLRALRIVRGRRMGKMVFYSLEDDHVRSLLAMVLGHQREPVTSTVEVSL
jgi:DNA-binding transcriptional ArsR family regulator